ncbi:glutamate 5-kinase [Salsuginibacillus kocurii]|uniref:glutamate 5-kinase n=1 Tax=Salsuginibacillus kocurii TaxID=427078 RepID=UPI000381E6A5|nr:glutamate 5-kinase [Salsuginibacillus kocurii]
MGKERIVVKIGSSSLTNEQGGLAEKAISEYVEAIARLKKQGHEVVVISSGAVAAGFNDLGYPTRPVSTAGKQAAAAVGQGALMQAYTEAFQSHGLRTAQILLTKENFANRSQYQNAYATLQELLKRQTIPIINENDTVSIDELTFGDNDMLSALVGGMMHARLLIMLTDINGIYDSNPNTNRDAKRYHFLPDVPEELVENTGSEGSTLGTGGMKSKIEAAQRALSLGLNVFIGQKQSADALLDVLAGKGNGTYIGYKPPSSLSISNKKQWVGLHSEVSGQLVIDAGAERALMEKGKSLLPAGIKETSGSYHAGDVVEVVNEKDERIGRGQVNMSSIEIQEIKGLPSNEAFGLIQTSRAEVIHRDDWVPLTKERT